MQNLKVVASTRIWEAKNPNQPDFPMWHPIGGSEYIIGYLDVPDGEAPHLSQIAEHVTNFMHLLEGKITPNVVEIFSGYEVYFVDTLTHNEAFQLQQGDSIDFPAEDVTKIEGQS